MQIATPVPSCIVPAMSHTLTESDVVKMMDSLSNWGRWGADDQLGALNLITPAKRLQAARLVQDGVGLTCARPITTEISADTTFQPMRFMVDSGEGRDACSPERVLERRGASEFIGMVFHGYTITHVDTPAHYFWNGRIYNGRSCNLITSREGAQVESVELLHDGVVSRGVLLDVAALKGRWLESGEGVMPEDLDAAEKAQGGRVEPGAIPRIRTGSLGRRLAGESDRAVLMAIRARLANITPQGQRQRFVTGVIALAAGVIAAGVLIVAGVSPGWLTLLFIPFWYGSLGLVQAREKT